jgi:3-hydroxyisobutyrate dehydrogenase-like beta-hydroxyacid dehydrogenase
MKSDVSVIGLGAMGAALAQALLHAEHRVTVWNRTSAKAEPLVRQGALPAPGASAAVGASPIVLVCVSDYTASHEILDAADVAPLLAGRLLVQLSTGSPQEAREGQAWARTRGADYLDGAIMAIPSQVATPEAAIFVSGEEGAFRRAEPLLQPLAGRVRYVGQAIGSASALDYATLSHVFGGLLGAMHGALICESEGLRVDAFGALLADLAPVVGGMMKHMSEVVQTGAYEHPLSSVSICAAWFESTARQAREAEINSEFPTFGLRIFQRAVAAGYAEESAAAVIKVLRETPRS